MQIQIKGYDERWKNGVDGSSGNFESLQAALDNGADSVYFGVEQLNMRARASINFTIDDLPEISKDVQN